MATLPTSSIERRKHDPTLEIRYKAGEPNPVPTATFRSLGLGLITGASDDDPSAIGTLCRRRCRHRTCVSLDHARYVPHDVCCRLSLLKAQVAGQGLFAVIKHNYPKWLLWFFLLTAVTGNVIEAGAHIGGMAAALNLLLPIPISGIIVVITLTILILQIWGSYTLIRNVFRWLALALLAYVGSAILAKPEIPPVIRGTLIPTIKFTKEFMAMLVAVIGATLSAYLYS